MQVCITIESRGGRLRRVTLLAMVEMESAATRNQALSA